MDLVREHNTRAAPKRELRHRDYAMIFTKYHQVGGALDMAVKSGFSRFFLKNQANSRKGGQLFPLKPTLFGTSLKVSYTKRSLRSDVDRSTDRQTK